MCRRHDFLRVLCIVGVLFIPLNAQGVEVEELYRASVTVVSRDDVGERKRAFSAAMREVLLKVSGTADVLQSNPVKRAVNNPEPYVESYVHRSLEATGDDNLQEEDLAGSQTELIELEISFFESEIQALLENNNLPLWSANRPETLVWLVVQEELGGREVFSNNDLTDEMLVLIRDEAKKRGLPLFFPLMDLEDQQALGPNELWNLDEGVIMAASRRYRTESILVIRMYRSLSGEALGKSLYLFRNRSLSYDSFEEPAEDFIDNSVSLAAEELSGYYAVLLSGGSGNTRVNMTIEGIDSAKDYAGLLNYVGSLTDVNSYQIVSVKQNILLLELATGGQLRQLVETIALEQNLEATGGLNRDFNGVYLYYRWVQ